MKQMNDNKLTIREKIGGILMLAALAISAGANIQAEYAAIWADEFHMKTGISVLIAFIALFVSGVLEE